MSSPAITEILANIGDGDVKALLTAVNAHATGSDLSGANELNAVLDRLSSIRGTPLYNRVGVVLAEFEHKYGPLTKETV